MIPGYRNAKILKKINPLRVPTVRVRIAPKGPSAIVKPDEDETFNRIGAFLVHMLEVEYILYLKQRRYPLASFWLSKHWLN